MHHHRAGAAPSACGRGLRSTTRGRGWVGRRADVRCGRNDVQSARAKHTGGQAAGSTGRDDFGKSMTPSHRSSSGRSRAVARCVASVAASIIVLAALLLVSVAFSTGPRHANSIGYYDSHLGHTWRRSTCLSLSRYTTFSYDKLGLSTPSLGSIPAAGPLFSPSFIPNNTPKSIPNEMRQFIGRRYDEPYNILSFEVIQIHTIVPLATFVWASDGNIFSPVQDRSPQYKVYLINMMYVLFTFSAAAWLFQELVCWIRLKRRMRAVGLCRVCKYDLKGGLAICPECGTSRC